MTVTIATAKNVAMHEGQTYYFCGAKCRTRFVAEPGRFINAGQKPAAPPAPAGTIFTCPMHPEIRQEGAGTCPICGMALEPELVTAESEPNPELADMSQRFWIGLALALPVFLLEMGGHLGARLPLAPQMSNWFQFALASPVVLWAGWPFFERGWASIRSGHLNMFTLIAIGTGVAWAYSVVGTSSLARSLCRCGCWTARCRSISRLRP